MEQRLLVVDDEPEIRRLLQEIFEDEGYAVETAANAAAARAAVAERVPDVVLLDIWMPDEDGVSLLKQWSAQGPPGFMVIMMSGHGTVETAVEAIRLGAFDYIEKPLSMDRLLLTVRRALETRRAARWPQGLPGREAQVLVGASAAMRRLRAQALAQAARHDGLLVGGEAGAGRHAFLRYMLAQGPRRTGAVVDLDAPAWAGALEAAIDRASPEPLAEALQTAQGGLLCLGELLRHDPPRQRRLLQALDGIDWSAVDVRLAGLLEGAGTPPERVAEGRLDAALAARFEGAFVAVPPLREHAEDVPELLRHFAERLQRADGLSPRPFSDEALAHLRRHPWSGNVAALAALVRRLMTAGRGVIGAEEALAALERPDADAFDAHALDAAHFQLPLKEARERFEHAYLLYWLHETDGNISRLAEQSGMERTHLYRKLRALGVDLKRDRGRS